MAFYKVPGVTMALIDGNAIAWAKAYGVLEAGTTRAVTADSVFEAASATKVLTTVLALRLVERGVLDLDRDVNAYLKSWKVPAGPLTAAQPVTLRLLLTHRAGINRPDKGLPFDTAHPPTLGDVVAGRAPATNQGVVVERAPGSGHSYSNIGFLVVQLVLEEATGKSYAATGARTGVRAARDEREHRHAPAGARVAGAVGRAARREGRGARARVRCRTPWRTAGWSRRLPTSRAWRSRSASRIRADRPGCCRSAPPS